MSQGHTLSRPAPAYVPAAPQPQAPALVQSKQPEPVAAMSSHLGQPRASGPAERIRGGCIPCPVCLWFKNLLPSLLTLVVGRKHLLHHPHPIVLLLTNDHKKWYAIYSVVMNLYPGQLIYAHHFLSEQTFFNDVIMLSTPYPIPLGYLGRNCIDIIPCLTIVVAVVAVNTIGAEL